MIHGSITTLPHALNVLPIIPGMGPQDMPPEYMEPNIPPRNPPYYDLPAGLMVTLVGVRRSVILK